MPYIKRKINGYRVTSPHGVKAKETSETKADSLIRLLHGVKHGWKPTGKKLIK